MIAPGSWRAMRSSCDDDNNKRRDRAVHRARKYRLNRDKSSVRSSEAASKERSLQWTIRRRSESEGDRTAPHFGSSAVRAPIEPDHIERAVSAARASGSTVAVISTADRDRWPTNQAYREDVWDPPAD